MTTPCPLIGNYGVNSEDNESSRPWVEALVVRHLSPRGSNFRCEDTLDDFLKQHNISGIQGVDTRALTKILRNQGSMNGMLTCAEHFNVAEALEKLKAYKVEHAVSKVTRTQPQVFLSLIHISVRNMRATAKQRGCDRGTRQMAASLSS